MERSEDRRGVEWGGEAEEGWNGVKTEEEKQTGDY